MILSWCGVSSCRIQNPIVKFSKEFFDVFGNRNTKSLQNLGSNLANTIITLFVTAIHKTTNVVFPNFFYEFFSAWAVEKDNKLFIGPKQIFSQFWTNEKFVFFFNCSTEKISWKKMRKTRFVVWWFDVTNWLNKLYNLKP